MESGFMYYNSKRAFCRPVCVIEKKTSHTKAVKRKMADSGHK